MIGGFYKHLRARNGLSAPDCVLDSRSLAGIGTVTLTLQYNEPAALDLRHNVLNEIHSSPLHRAIRRSEASPSQQQVQHWRRDWQRRVAALPRLALSPADERSIRSCYGDRFGLGHDVGGAGGRGANPRRAGELGGAQVRRPMRGSGETAVAGSEAPAGGPCRFQLRPWQFVARPVSRTPESSAAREFERHADDR